MREQRISGCDASWRFVALNAALAYRCGGSTGISRKYLHLFPV